MATLIEAYPLALVVTDPQALECASWLSYACRPACRVILAMQLKNFSIGKRHNDGEGKVMRDIAERMNENEIQAVASYIAGLRP